MILRNPEYLKIKFKNKDIKYSRFRLFNYSLIILTVHFVLKATLALKMPNRNCFLMRRNSHKQDA